MKMGLDEMREGWMDAVYEATLNAFNKGRRLDPDIINNGFTMIAYVLMGSLHFFPRLNPLKHYEEYVRHAQRTRPEVLELILERSEVEAVRAFDDFVDRYNAALEGIKERKDMVTLRKFYDEAMQLINSTS